MESGMPTSKYEHIFLPWEFLVIKKLELEKISPPNIQLLNIKSGLSFSDFQLFLLTKISREGKCVRKKSTYWREFGFSKEFM